MRTRLLMHENRKLKKYIERNGLNITDILLDQGPDLTLATNSQNSEAVTEERTLQTLVDTLRVEQKRSSALEADLYVLQIDYDALLEAVMINKNS